MSLVPVEVVGKAPQSGKSVPEKLSREALALFEARGTRLHLTRGDCLYPEDADGVPCVYLLVHGFARLVIMNDEGKRFSMSILQAGDFLGPIGSDQGVTVGSETDEFLEAMVDIQVLRVTGADFAMILEANPKLCVTMLQLLQARSQLAQRKLTELLFKDVYARIAQLFLEMMFEHGKPCPYAFGMHKDLSLKHHEIAELIGASRPVTSVALSRFAKADLIHKHDGLICLQDLGALARVAELGCAALTAFEQPGAPMQAVVS